MGKKPVLTKDQKKMLDDSLAELGGHHYTPEEMSRLVDALTRQILRLTAPQEVAKGLGARGGYARAKNLSKAQLSKIGKDAAAKRWSKKGDK